LALGALALVALSACSAPDEDPPTAPAVVEMAHLHSIQLSPGGDAIFIATHNGLFQLALDGSGPPQPMPVVAFDAMGFTVISDKATLLASGHAPSGSNLGLMRSVSGGSTWETLPSTAGRDFHVVTASESSIFAIDSESGDLWASLDSGSTWSQEAAVEAADLAVVGPTLYATTAEGLQESSDGGATFTLSPDAPLLLYVDNDATRGEATGIQADGAVWTIANNRWAQAGTFAGIPLGFAIDPDGELIVASASGIFISKDAVTWRPLWKP
jgi:hypothetical protein